MQSDNVMATDSKKIVIIGSSNTDLVVRVEHFPQAGEALNGPGAVVIGRKEGDIVHPARKQVLAHLLSGAGTECGIEERPVVLADVAFGQRLHGMFPPHGDRVGDFGE